MPFNTKDPRWIAMRTERHWAKLRDGKTCCPVCRQEMWFSDFELIPDYVARAGAKVRAPSEAVATLDHLVPLSRGGTFHTSNLTTMCAECNEDKGAADPLAWIATQRDKGVATKTYLGRLRRRALRVQRFIENLNSRKGDTHG